MSICIGSRESNVDNFLTGSDRLVLHSDRTSNLLRISSAFGKAYVAADNLAFGQNGDDFEFLRMNGDTPVRMFHFNTDSNVFGTPLSVTSDMTVSGTVAAGILATGSATVSGALRVSSPIASGSNVSNEPPAFSVRNASGTALIAALGSGSVIVNDRMGVGCAPDTNARLRVGGDARLEGRAVVASNLTCPAIRSPFDSNAALTFGSNTIALTGVVSIPQVSLSAAAVDSMVVRGLATAQRAAISNLTGDQEALFITTSNARRNAVRVDGEAGSNLFVVSPQGHIGIGTSPGPLSVAVATADKLVAIDPLGNLGVGTAAPASALHVRRREGTRYVDIGSNPARPATVTFDYNDFDVDTTVVYRFGLQASVFQSGAAVYASSNDTTAHFVGSGLITGSSNYVGSDGVASNVYTGSNIVVVGTTYTSSNAATYSSSNDGYVYYSASNGAQPVQVASGAIYGSCNYTGADNVASNAYFASNAQSVAAVFTAIDPSVYSSSNGGIYFTPNQYVSFKLRDSAVIYGTSNYVEASGADATAYFTSNVVDFGLCNALPPPPAWVSTSNGVPVAALGGDGSLVLGGAPAPGATPAWQLDVRGPARAPDLRTASIAPLPGDSNILFNFAGLHEVAGIECDGLLCGTAEMGDVVIDTLYTSNLTFPGVNVDVKVTSTFGVPLSNLWFGGSAAYFGPSSNDVQTNPQADGKIKVVVPTSAVTGKSTGLHVVAQGGGDLCARVTASNARARYEMLTITSANSGSSPVTGLVYIDSTNTVAIGHENVEGPGIVTKKIEATMDRVTLGTTKKLVVQASSGNVGIALDTGALPTVALEVNGSVWLKRQVLGVYATTLFADSSSGNVGIGTKTPIATLHVQGDVYSQCNVTAPTFKGSFVGDGSGVTGISANNIRSGVLTNNQLPGTITATFFGTGTGLSMLNAANIGVGTLPNACLPANISVTSLTGTHFGTGTGLSMINAANIGVGTLPNACLPANISVTSLSGNLIGTWRPTVSAWNSSSDNRYRLLFVNNDRTYFGSPNGYAFRSSQDWDLATLSDQGDVNVTGNVTVAKSLTVSGNSTVSGTSTVSGALTVNGNVVTGTYITLNNYGDGFVQNSQGAGVRFLNGNLVAPATGNGSTFLGYVDNRWNVLFTSGSPNVSSDSNLKTCINDSELGLDFVLKLRPVSYKWKDESKDQRTHYGFIAQEVKELADRYVEDFGGWSTGCNVGSQGLAYGEFTAPIVKAIQGLHAEVQDLKEQLAALQRSP